MYNIQYPCGAFQTNYNPQNIPFLEPKTPVVVGEGDIVSTTSPDGTVLFYFVPTLRRNTYPQQYHVNITNSTQECWYIRCICNVHPSVFFNNNTPNVPGGQIIANNTTGCDNNYCSNQYFQKFHNDKNTSTTDIRYFYPSRCPSEKLNISAAVQAEPQSKFNTYNYNRENINKNYGTAADECMSVDDTPDMSNRMEAKPTQTYKDVGEKSNKLTATYRDTSSGSTVRAGRKTQTERKKYEKSDVKIEEFKPKRKKTQDVCCNCSCSCTYLI